MMSELNEKKQAFHFVGIPTTEAERAAKKTSNKRLRGFYKGSSPMESEAFD